MAWEIDWDRMQWNGKHWQVWARNPESTNKLSRDWHWTWDDTIKNAGLWKDRRGSSDWEFDWTKKKKVKGALYVWARNLGSTKKSAREWHWINYAAVQKLGVPWQRNRQLTGRYINDKGYIFVNRSGMTDEQIKVADECSLWTGTRKKYVLEHRLVAATHYGKLPKGQVVRHLNGDKQDNRIENLVLGSHRENSQDHKTATLDAMYWRQRALAAEYLLLTLGIEKSEAGFGTPRGKKSLSA